MLQLLLSVMGFLQITTTLSPAQAFSSRPLTTTATASSFNQRSPSTLFVQPARSRTSRWDRRRSTKSEPSLNEEQHTVVEHDGANVDDDNTHMVDIDDDAALLLSEATRMELRFASNESYNFWQDPFTAQSFNMDLANLAHEDPRQAHDALEIMYELHSQQKSGQKSNHSTMAVVEPNAACYVTVIEGYVQAGDPESAQQVLDAMEERLGIGEFHANMDISTYTAVEQAYFMVSQAWSHDFKGDFLGYSAEKAEALLYKRALAGNVKLWSIALEAWCKRAGICRSAMSRADALLEKMEESWEDQQQKRKEDDGIDKIDDRTRPVPSVPPPNIITYTSYIGGLARSKQNDLARKAEATLERMEQHGVPPDVVSYTSVLNCWSRAVSRIEREMAARRAIRILDEMERLYINKAMYHVKPSHITYATAIKAIGNSLDLDGPGLAEDILRRMYHLSSSQKIANLKPTTSTWNAVLHALSRAKGDNRVRHAKRAEQILAEMRKRAETEPGIAPDVRTWAAVMRAWARSQDRDSAKNAQRILDQLESLYAAGKTHVRPNYVCYTICMGAWAAMGTESALNKMEEMLMKMEKIYEETQEPDMRPNSITYVTAVDAFVNNAERAQATVDRMMTLYKKGLGHVRPSTVVFNTLLNAWSKCRHPDAAQRAEKIFQWMEAQANQGDDFLRPDDASLCAVLNAWANQAKNGGAERAQQIFEHMQSIPPQRRGFHLNTLMVNIVIKAIARSGKQDSVRRAEELMERLERGHIVDKSTLKPDVATYCSVINCCAYCNDPQGHAEALDVALRAFQKVCDLEDDAPNNVIFGTVLKAISKLMPYGPEREELVANIFDQCCELGTVDGFVLFQLSLAGPEVFKNLTEGPCGLCGPDSDCSIRTLLKNVPLEWKAYVVDAKRYSE